MFLHVFCLFGFVVFAFLVYCGVLVLFLFFAKTGRGVFFGRFSFVLVIPTGSSLLVWRSNEARDRRERGGLGIKSTRQKQNPAKSPRAKSRQKAQRQNLKKAEEHNPEERRRDKNPK